ncbi:MAG: HNH endonuclease [Candidatus Thorarchaeota archaeon]
MVRTHGGLRGSGSVTSAHRQSKDELLGIKHGTAANQLRKMVMFQLVQQTGRDTCHQCGEKIRSVKELSIEHKEPWQRADNPKDSFFDLDNIAFSHLSCNVAAAKKVGVNPNYQLGRETCAKLTKEQAGEVKQLLRKGTMSQRAIAEMYRLHHSSVWAIASGKSWKDA